MDVMKIFRAQRQFVEDPSIKNSEVMSLNQLQALLLRFLQIYDQESSSLCDFEHIFPFPEQSVLSLDLSSIL
jgi:hypothetical protein